MYCAPRESTIGANSSSAFQPRPKAARHSFQVPEDLQQFSDTLEIPLMEVPNWYAEFRLNIMRPTAPRGEPIEAQEQRYRRQ